ncbi:hypothetical protein GALMADRAFT_67889 [Galerina marginata CBS 339.88]|uniref:Zn(2)-C6 fungal-type domain-containing protein n=1 Tax=Galerina marginata (strain CBS 339.88) TaxID=685588 RepID=A0A067TBC3_GALM3|nr:hypothetical protein GALMADRAFT_67889 [Galerina marginata CBS 339.88]
MSNSYNTGQQQWNQNNFSSLQLEQEFEFDGLSGSINDRRQQQVLQQGYGSADSYQYSQQQQHPPNPPSSLHAAFALPQNSQPSHSRSSSFGANQSGQNSASGGYAHGVYGSRDATPPHGTSSLPYRFNFNSSVPMSMQNMDTNHIGGVTSSPGPIHETFGQTSTSSSKQPYYLPKQESPSALPQAKRHHAQAFKDEFNDDPDSDLGQQDPKDANKSKLSRACARCKTLKVRCEAKTETEPCKRCFNGGHECVIPGRKIRRTPPKREHLLKEIQSQAKEIERLMRELEKVSVSSKQAKDPGHNNDSTNLQSPVLSPSSTSGSYFSSEVHPGGTMDDGSFTSPDERGGDNPAMNKAVEDWIAKARESLHEFGAFIGIGGAGMPKSYLVEEDFEEEDEEDDTDVAEEGDYDVSVEDPNGEDVPYSHGSATSNGPRGRLNHKLSDSSIGTAATGGGTMPRKKNSTENAKPANLPVGASPFGLFGELALKTTPKSRAGSAERDEEDKGPGIANADFFKSTTAPHALGRRLESAQHQAPAILTRGIISPQEAEKLFKIYFDNMNLSVSLLDPVLYTAQRTFYRSPFLFTVICAIASRFYSERSDLYAKCMHYAQLAAGTALIGGSKNVEMCCAYILLSLYPVPARKWEDQRSWLYLGLAIRTATDLNLHLPTTAKPLNENHAREMLNRRRIWMNCLNLDRSTGSQYGKPPIISPNDYIANHSEDWWMSSPYNLKYFDIHICGYSAELKVMSAFVAKIHSDPHHPTGLNKSVDFEKIATETDDELQALHHRWFTVINQLPPTDDQQFSFRTGLLRLAYSYARLVALSYGFQHAFGKNNVDENPFLMRCLRAASDVVDTVVNDVCRPEQLHYFRHGPEAQSVFVTFASAFLVKLLQPRFASYLNPETRTEIRSLVQKVINLLGSPAVAIDERHGPKLYSRFLEKLLAKPMARSDPFSPGSAANAPLPQVRSLPKPLRSKSGSGPAPDSNASGTFDVTIPSTVYNHPSPSTSNSLSPPATESALSFDTFAPVGPIDPFALEIAAASAAANNTVVDGSNAGNMMMTDFFQPPLPFDDHILQSMQSLTDPSGWQDISLPGFNWMAQFQENLGLDLNAPLAYDQNMDYMTGPANN